MLLCEETGNGFNGIFAIYPAFKKLDVVIIANILNGWIIIVILAIEKVGVITAIKIYLSSQNKPVVKPPGGIKKFKGNRSNTCTLLFPAEKLTQSYLSDLYSPCRDQYSCQMIFAGAYPGKPF